MSETKHTAGPWVQDKPTSADIRCATGDIAIAICQQMTILDLRNSRLAAHSRVEAYANARLIAAAPDLLEALQWYVETDETNEGQDGNEFWDEGRNRARAAIARATGAQP